MDDFKNINETETDVTETDVTETDVTETDVTETDVTETDVTETDVTETDVTKTDDIETDENGDEWTIDEGGQIALTEVNPNTIDNSAYLENITTTIIFLDACIIGCFVALLFAIGFKKE